MKLYYNPLSTYSQKVMIAFYEKGISFTPERVDLASPEARLAYQAVNPTGKVPFLKPSEDWQVPESTSIIEYLEDKFPGTPRLISRGDADAARQARFLDRMADLYYNDPVVELLLQHLGIRVKDQERADLARRHVNMTYSFWAKRLSSQPWMCGPDFSIADCAAIPALFYAQTVAPFGSQPNVVAYWERAQQRPSYVRVREEFEPIWLAMLTSRKAA